MTLSEPEYKLECLAPFCWAVTKNGQIVKPIYNGIGSASRAVKALHELKWVKS